MADTAQLQSETDKLNEVKNGQIESLNARVSALAGQLRNRAERPNGGGMPKAPADGKGATGCTGAQLYRSDSEFLARLGRDADELRIRLKACYTQYDAAREKLETVGVPK